ncbi:MAG TPA: hypothetical protein VFL68_08905 [Pseudolabrys sp.]|jgi:hypothetical protein|nr:hypothetical protein [Pseudolabrys sp.]
MTRIFWQALFSGTVVAALLSTVQPPAAETLFHRAENQVPVAIVEIKRPAEHTEIHLQAQAALTKVCFAASGPNSPYLLAAGRNYRYLGGDNVTACPERRDYAAGAIMMLRFEPLAAGSSTFSFVSGQSGEKQPIDVVSPTTPYWNFLRVRLN